MIHTYQAQGLAHWEAQYFYIFISISFPVPLYIVFCETRLNSRSSKVTSEVTPHVYLKTKITVLKRFSLDNTK